MKFADAELIGIPYRVTIGPRALAEGEVELTNGATGDTTRVLTDTIADSLAATDVSQSG